MNIPRFWAAAEEEVASPRGGRLALKCWGWSQDGLTEARTRAREALGRLIDRVRQGAPFPERYAYSDRALREEVVREIEGSSGPAALITRNSYGSLVLNTSRVMFIDIDVSSPEKATGWFKRKQDQVDAALGDLRQRLGGLAGAFRIYKTKAGFRVLALDRCYDPGSADSEQVMRSLGADPKFVQLCAAQKSFRARLTPKPWRCGCRVPPSQFPRQTSDQTSAFENWLAGYESAAKGFASCKRIEDAGAGGTNDEVSRVVLWHDEFTKADSSLPLA